MPTWPASLPTSPLRDSLQFTSPNCLISTPMDSGPPKVRRKFTRNYRPMQGTWAMSDEQKVVWQTFFNEELQRGALSFDMPDPNTDGATCLARINPEQMPVYRSDGATNGKNDWLVTLSLLVL